MLLLLVNDDPSEQFNMRSISELHPGADGEDLKLIDFGFAVQVRLGDMLNVA